MGQAEVFRLDQEDWKDQVDLYGDDEGGKREADGGGQRWLPEADGADQAVEQYWESRGLAASETTDMAETEELDGDGAGAEDADMWADLGVAEEADSEQCRSWSEEQQRAKKRRTGLELQKVRGLGRVRQAAFDKKR